MLPLHGQLEETATLKLNQSEAQFQALVENLPELAWTARLDGYVDFYNRGWYEYTGTTFEQMQGWGWESVHDPKMLPAVLERWKLSLSTGVPFEMEYPLRDAAGAYRWFLTRIRPLKSVSRFDADSVGVGSRVVVKAPGVLRIRTAKHRVEQMVVNLLDNAVKYGAGKRIEIQLTLTRTGRS